jgi:hypothetical protein
MEELKIYWTGIEYSYAESSSKFGELQGGFVYGFVQAIDARDALAKFDDRLKSENLIPKQVEFISLYDLEMEWETEEQTNSYCRLVGEAQETWDVIFDDFYAFENEV